VNELHAIIWQAFFDMGISAKDFNCLQDKEKSEFFNSVRFLTKQKLLDESISLAERAGGYRAIDRTVGEILFD